MEHADAIGREHLNPTRPYHDVRPRQMARGLITLTGPATSATLSLYNESLGDRLLVVRAYNLFTTVAHLVLVQLQQGKQGTAGGSVAPMIPGENVAGTLYSLDTATVLPAPDYMVDVIYNRPAWDYAFPFQVLHPNWSLTFQDTTAAETMRLALMWEAIYPDQLDYFR
jgi:hypothetical protein